MNPKDILLFIKALASEKKVSTELIFEAVENTMVILFQKDFGEHSQISVMIDRNNGSMQGKQTWEIINDEEYFQSEFKDAYIALKVAKKLEENAEIGGVIEETLDVENGSRIGAHNFKQTLLRLLRDIDRDKTAKRFEDRMDDLITGEVKRLLKDFLILELQDGTEMMLPRNELIPREMIRLGDRVKACVIGINDQRQGPVVIVSRSSTEMLKSLFLLEVPEITDGTIEIKAAAREPGIRAKIAVKANDKRIDPIGACVGMRGIRVQSISSELNGERIDIINWEDDPAKLAISAISPAEAKSVLIDETNNIINITVDEEQLSQAIGRNGQNVRLASQLLGWEVNVSSNETQETSSLDDLNLSQDIVELLNTNGINHLDDFSSKSDVFESIESLSSDDKVKILGNVKELTKTSTPLDSLLSIDDVTIIHLESAGIHSIEELLEKEINDIENIEGIDTDIANRIYAEAQMLI
ncbi:MAG: transcription termination factor NusA [Gammaproteobacteria bacterium]|nr:transcription termination factor NusA [Gammaproteobacteria bacterium]